MSSIAAAVALAFTLTLDPMEAEQARLFNLELTRFPPAKLTRDCLKLNSKHLDWLDIQIEFLPTKQIIEWRDECSDYEDCWRNLYLAQDSRSSL